MSNRTHTVRRIERVTEAQIESLAAVLVDCVEGGASVSFMHPLSLYKARAICRGVSAYSARRDSALFVPEDAS